jgi:amino acid transporter
MLKLPVLRMQVCIAMAFAVYIVQAISYLVLFRSYPNIKRSFFSPFGLAGAYWVLFIFSLALTGSLFFQPNTYVKMLFLE